MKKNKLFLKTLMVYSLFFSVIILVNSQYSSNTGIYTFENVSDGFTQCSDNINPIYTDNVFTSPDSNYVGISLNYTGLNTTYFEFNATIYNAGSGYINLGLDNDGICGAIDFPYVVQINIGVGFIYIGHGGDYILCNLAIDLVEHVRWIQNGSLADIYLSNAIVPNCSLSFAVPPDKTYSYIGLGIRDNQSTIDNASISFGKPEPPLTYCAWGDSMTYSDKVTPTYSYATRIQNYTKWTTTLNALDGWSTRDLINNKNLCIGANHHNISTILIGTNDFTNGNLSFYNDLTELIGYIKADNQDIYLWTISPLPFYPPINLENSIQVYNAFNKIIKRVSFEQNVKLFDNWLLVFNGTYNESNYVIDGFHPNPHTHDIQNTTFLAEFSSLTSFDCSLNYTQCWNMTLEGGTNCTEDWVGYNTTCVNNNQTLYYLDNNLCGTYVNLPINNGTVSSCSNLITGYVPIHSTSDVSAVVIDFIVEYGLQMILFAGLLAIIGIGIWILNII